MENTPTVLDAMFTNIGTVITNLVTLMGTMTSALLSNELFQIVLGIVFFSIAMGIVFTLVRKVKSHGK